MTETGGTTTPDPSGEATPVPGDVRGELEASREALAEQLHDLGVEGESGIVDENFADSAAVSAEQGEAQALAARLREQLDDVEKALARLDEGTYGTCEVCGNPIGEARLEAMPATRFCIDHAG
jgi:DnaK suppressor protein